MQLSTGLARYAIDKDNAERLWEASSELIANARCWRSVPEVSSSGCSWSLRLARAIGHPATWVLTLVIYHAEPYLAGQAPGSMRRRY